MRPEEYEKLAATEDAHWWFVGLRNNLIGAFRLCGGKPSGRFLDAGCGTGALVRKLVQAFPSSECVGVDLDETACRFASRKSTCSICVASVNETPFNDSAFDAIFSADVLCHAGVDVEASIGGFYKTLKSGGTLVMNLPAYPWLMSEHDRAVSNSRRFTRTEVRSLLSGAGFLAVRATYWNTILFPIMVLHRKLMAKGASSDVEEAPGAMNAVFKAVMGLENWLLQRGMMLPFGGSLLVTGLKP